jgi:hypothetical protein
MQSELRTELTRKSSHDAHAKALRFLQIEAGREPYAVVADGERKVVSPRRARTTRTVHSV